MNKTVLNPVEQEAVRRYGNRENEEMVHLPYNFLQGMLQDTFIRGAEFQMKVYGSVKITLPMDEVHYVPMKEYGTKPAK